MATTVSDYVKKRINQIRGGPSPMDEKEKAEREEAAVRYSGEKQQHFVDFCEDAVKTSSQAMESVRRIQSECWALYNEDEPPNFMDKESWQSRVILPKPNASVQFAQAIVRKAFDTEFLSIQNALDEKSAKFWEELISLMLSSNYGNFSRQFTDATGMGFAVGTSMEVIPIWRPNQGLRFILVEPWKIHRDPDAVAREPQSGMYWIHQEYVDYWVLKQFESQGRYINIPAWSGGASPDPHPSDPDLQKEQIEKRKSMFYQRSKFRNLVLTSEYWGHVLSPNGELLLEDATYTIAGGKVIQPPKASPYNNIRWPGVSFAPIPHLLRHDGRGLLQGIRTLWYFMSSLLCLYNDYMNWMVNPPTEIDINSLADPTDIDDMPGKQWLTRGTPHGEQVVRTIDRPSRTTDVLAVLNYGSQAYDEGVLVNNVIKGLPGYRAEVTAREVAQQLDQSMTVFGLIGSNLSDGALHILTAAADTIAINITEDELRSFMGDEWAALYSKGGQLELPEISTGSFHISGISSLMRDWEIVQNIAQLILPLYESPVFQPYTQPYNLCLALEKRLNLEDEKLFVDPETAQRVNMSQQQVQEQVIQDEGAQSTAMTEQMQREAMSTPTQPEETPTEEQPYFSGPNQLTPEMAMESRAEGGPVEEGQQYLVGETVPERIDFLYGGSTVVGEEGPEVVTPLAPGIVKPLPPIDFRYNPNSEE